MVHESIADIISFSTIVFDENFYSAEYFKIINPDIFIDNEILIRHSKLMNTITISMILMIKMF